MFTFYTQPKTIVFIIVYKFVESICNIYVTIRVNPHRQCSSTDLVK